MTEIEELKKKQFQLVRLLEQKKRKDKKKALQKEKNTEAADPLYHEKPNSEP